MSKKKNNVVVKKSKFTRLDDKLFNYQYVKNKEGGKKILFVMDEEAPFRVSKKIKATGWFGKDKIDTPKNVKKVSFKNIKFDGDETVMTGNRKYIKKTVKDILKKGKEYNKVAIPSKGLGLILKDKAPQSYEYLKKKVRENESNNLFSDIESNKIVIKNKKGNEKVSYRKNNKLSKKHKKKVKKATKQTKKLLKKAEEACGVCQKGFALINRPLFTKKSKEAKEYVEQLENIEKKCKKCSKKCAKIKKLIGTVKDKERVLADYPSICKIQSTNKLNKAERMQKDVYNKIIQQKNKLNEEDNE